MEPKKEILKHLKKSAKPNLPENFFDDFNMKMMKIIEKDSNPTFRLSDLNKRAKPEDGAIFFKDFSNKIAKQVHPKSKVKQLFIYASAIAAIGILLFSMPYMTNNGSVDQLGITYAEQEEILLSYVSEYDIIDYYTESTVSSSEEVMEEVLLDEMNFDVYDYYLEQ